MILANSSTLVSLLSPIVTAAIFVVGAITAWITFRLRKRSQSGNIQTSEAGQLWTQTQSLITQLSADKAAAEAQRDKLLDSQSAQVLPLLTVMNDMLKQLIQLITKDTQPKEKS